jgi:hypothetical protein
MNDNYVTTLSPSKQKGLNVVYWNYQTSTPKTASGKTFSQGGMFAPRAAAGKYKVVIEKGKDTYSTTIDIEYPKNSVFTLAERKSQEETTRKLFAMNEELAYIVHQIDEWTKHAEKHAKSEPKLTKSGTKLAADLQKLKATMVITTGDNYVGRAENMLREDLGEIYSTIGSNFGPPTASQLENVKLIEDQMMDARNGWKAIQSGDLKKYIAMLPKLEIKDAEIETFEQYVNKD